MDGIFLFALNGSSLINRVSDDIHNPAEGFWPDWDTDGSTRISDFLASDQSFSGIHSNGPDPGVSQMLGHLQHQSVFDTVYFEGVEDGWDFSLELHIYDCSDNLS